MRTTSPYARMASSPVYNGFYAGDIDDAASRRPKPAKTQPGVPANILLICLERAVLANSGLFGGPCAMPVFEQLAFAGHTLSDLCQDSTDDFTLTDCLRSRGYATARFGGSEPFGHLPLGHAFDHIDAMVSERQPFGGRDHAPACHYTECMTSRAIDWLDRHAGQSPFFLCWSPQLPTSQREVPHNWIEKHRSRFETAELAALGGFLDYIDYQFGRLFNALEERQLTDDTLIIVIGAEDKLVPTGLFADMLVEEALDPEKVALYVRAHIAAKGGAEAYLEKAAVWRNQRADMPHWAHIASARKPIVERSVILHGPAGDSLQRHDAPRDIMQLVLTVTQCISALPKPTPVRPDLCLVYTFPTASR